MWNINDTLRGKFLQWNKCFHVNTTMDPTQTHWSPWKTTLFESFNNETRVAPTSQRTFCRCTFLCPVLQRRHNVRASGASRRRRLTSLPVIISPACELSTVDTLADDVAAMYGWIGVFYQPARSLWFLQLTNASDLIVDGRHLWRRWN